LKIKDVDLIKHGRYGMLYCSKLKFCLSHCYDDEKQRKTKFHVFKLKINSVDFEDEEQRNRWWAQESQTLREA
jgi:hypothetical protein